MSQSNYEAGVARQNARLSVEAARESEKTGLVERRKFWRDVGNVKGQQIAAMAANGIDVGYGTAARIQDDTQMLANEDAEALYGNIHQRTRGYLINAANYASEAKAAKARGKAALVGSVFQAGSELAGGFQKAAALRRPPAPSSLMGEFQQLPGLRAKLGISSAYPKFGR
jgi:hypothetical protein